MTRPFLRSIIAAAALLAMALPAAAHPLGNFTVNQHVGLSGHRDGIVVTYIVDMAEIPAARELARLGPEPDLGALADTWCAEALEAVAVTVDGTRAMIAADSAQITTPEGEAGLPTLRLECGGLVATAFPAAISIANANRLEQPGWREIVVDTSISGTTDLPRTSASERLSLYPADAPLLDVTTGSIAATGSTTAAPATFDPAASEATGIPRAVARALDTAGGFGLVAIAAAFALGAGHALAPGHGKTLMAAFLLARNGTARHAVGLGLATAVSHTIGVAVLGAITLLATKSLAPERLYPVLSVASASTITALGAGMLIKSIRGRRHHHHDHDHDHDHGHDHGHDHHHPHDHHHVHASETGDRPLGWRSMAALGLAGGMVPSASAVVLFLAAVRYGRPVLGLVLVALFGLGMSTVLVGAGLSVLSVRDLATRRSGGGWRFVARLQPLAGAVVAIGGVVLSVGAIQNL